jgi:hypothetical protein
MIAARAEIIVGVGADQEPLGRSRHERHMQASVARTMARARAEHALGPDALAAEEFCGMGGVHAAPPIAERGGTALAASNRDGNAPRYRS